MRKLLLSTTLLACSHAFAGTLSIVADEWYPMNGTPNAKKPGYMIELAETIFSAHNIDVTYTLMPWERAVKETRLGKHNCVVGAYKVDTPDFVFPKQHWGIDSPQFFVKEGETWQYTGEISSLKNRKLGLISGYSYSDKIDQYAASQKGSRIQFARGDNALAKNINKLIYGRIDTLIESINVFHAKINSMQVTQPFIAAGNATPPVEMYIACSPNLPSSKKYMDIVDTETIKLKRNGQLKTILDRYGIDEWK